MRSYTLPLFQFFWRRVKNTYNSFLFLSKFCNTLTLFSSLWLILNTGNIHHVNMVSTQKHCLLLSEQISEHQNQVLSALHLASCWGVPSHSADLVLHYFHDGDGGDGVDGETEHDSGSQRCRAVSTGGRLEERASRGRDCSRRKGTLPKNKTRCLLCHYLGGHHRQDFHLPKNQKRTECWRQIRTQQGTEVLEDRCWKIPNWPVLTGAGWAGSGGVDPWQVLRAAAPAPYCWHPHCPPCLPCPAELQSEINNNAAELWMRPGEGYGPESTDKILWKVFGSYANSDVGSQCYIQ